MNDRDAEAKARMVAWRAMPEPKVAWEQFKKVWRDQKSEKKSPE